MKKAQVFYRNGEYSVEATIVENLDDFNKYGINCTPHPDTLLKCIGLVPTRGPVIINSKGGMCNLLDLPADNSNIEIYEDGVVSASPNNIKFFLTDATAF